MATAFDDVEGLLQQIISGERDIDDLDEEEVVMMRNKLNPYGQAVALDNNDKKLFAYSLINLKEEYLKKFLTTSLIGFLYKRADEHGVPDGDYVVPVEELDRNEITHDFISENVVDGNVVLKKETPAGVSGGEDFTQEESTANKFKRIVIREFLDDMFTFNPDKHVRSAYQRNKHDPERQKVKTSKKKKSEKYKKDSKASAKLTQEERNLLEYGRVTGKIPPVDLFHHFTTYMDVNYDALRIATRNLYCEKPDLDYTLNVYTDLPSMAEYNDFVHKHEDDIPVIIRCCEQNKWTFQANFAENRDRQQFYNKNTRVLQEILDTAEANQRLGKDILNKRIRRKKQQNIDECGPDDDKFIKQYKKEQRKQHRKAGLKEPSEKERAQQELEDKYLNRYDKPDDMLDEEEYKDAIQIQTWTHDTKGKKLKPSSFFSQSEKVDAQNTKLGGGE